MSDEKKTTPTPNLNQDTEALADVKQLGMFAAIASLSYVFWVCGGMEMIERLAYYGVKAVATLYAKDPKSAGGLGITMSDFGIILTSWALVQSLLPIISGSFSDRYGYKRTIFISTIVKISGYLTMAFFASFTGFFVGAMLLAAGTAVFKPGIQGTFVKATNRQNSSMAWGIFYQTVNIGGWMGPLLAGLMRKMAWENVFFACAAIISLNFLMLLLYKEPGQEERLAAPPRKENLFVESFKELSKPHVWTYLAIFSGFWFMFNALFDVLPAHIDDWVDTTVIVKTLFPSGNVENWLLKFVVVMNEQGTAIQPEGLLNLNAGLIMLTCFIFAAISARMRATTSMVVGTLLSTVALFLIGATTSGWIMVFVIMMFSIGEMLSSPKFTEFIGNIAPSDKKAMYLGFSQVSLAIGWTLEGYFGPLLYEIFASKDRFSRDFMLERLNELGVTADFVNQIPQGEAFDKLVSLSDQSAATLTQIMYESHNIGAVWYIMAIIGLFSAVGIYIYGMWIRKLTAK